MKSRNQPIGQLARVSTLGGLLGIKTGPLLQRLAPLAAACDEHLAVTATHAFDALTITTRTDRALAREVCGAWIDELAGDELELAVDADTITAWSDEAALPASAPPQVHGDELALLGFDGAAWTYVLERGNAGEAATDATVARIDALAAELGVTESQRRVAANLHRSFARDLPNRLWVRARAGSLEPIVGVVWDRVEWTPLQSMLKGFYPGGQGVEKISRLSRANDAEHATVELVLGPTDPPAVRFTFAP